MSKNCEEFQKIHDEFYIEVNEKLEEFKRSYAEAKENGNVNLGGGKNFFEELERFKSEIREKKEKLTAKTPEDINAKTRIYLGGFEKGDEEIFQNLENPLFINEDVDFAFSEEITKIPENVIFNRKTVFFQCNFLAEISKNVVFNEHVDFCGCESLTEIPENVVFNKSSYFGDCTSLTEISKNTVFNGNTSFYNCTSLTTISENLTFFGDVSFKDCISLGDETIEQLKQMKSDGRIKGILTLPDGTTIR